MPCPCQIYVQPVTRSCTDWATPAPAYHREITQFLRGNIHNLKEADFEVCFARPSVCPAITSSWGTNSTTPQKQWMPLRMWTRITSRQLGLELPTATQSIYLRSINWQRTLSHFFIKPTLFLSHLQWRIKYCKHHPLVSCSSRVQGNWSMDITEKLTAAQVTKKFRLYWNPKVHCHWIPSWAR
jgi:hypothetical protein